MPEQLRQLRNESRVGVSFAGTDVRSFFIGPQVDQLICFGIVTVVRSSSPLCVTSGYDSFVMALFGADRRVPKVTICRFWIDENPVGRH